MVLLSGLAVLAFSAPVAQATVIVARGTQRGGLVDGTSGGGVTAVTLVAFALVVGGLAWAIVSDRNRVPAARSSGEPQQLPKARSDEPDETRKAA